jgi:hypothetical protein
MQRMFALALAPLLSTGCLAAKLKGPAEDHYIQTRAIADRCIDQADEDQCADLVAMCDQAEAISAITRGKEAVGCYAPEPGEEN